MNNHSTRSAGIGHLWRGMIVLAVAVMAVTAGGGAVGAKPSAAASAVTVTSYDSVWTQAECAIGPCEVVTASADHRTGTAASHLEVAPPFGAGAWAYSTVAFSWSAHAPVKPATKVTWRIHIRRAELVQELGGGRTMAGSITASARAFKGNTNLCRTQTEQAFPAGTTTFDVANNRKVTVIEDTTVEIVAVCEASASASKGAVYGQVIIRDSVSGGTGNSHVRSTYDLQLQSITVG